MIQIAGTAPLPHDIWETIIEYGAPQDISGLTPLLVFTSYGNFFRELTAHMSNEAAATPCQLILDVSHGGLRPNVLERRLVDIDPLTEGRVTVSAPNPFTYVRVYGMTSGPTVSIMWALLGLRR